MNNSKIGKLAVNVEMNNIKIEILRLLLMDILELNLSYIICHHIL